MASFVSSKAVDKRDRRVSNGGLGGCVQLSPQGRSPGIRSMPTWPLRRQIKPPAVKVGFNQDDLKLSTMTPRSVVVHDTTIGGGFNFPVEDGMATTLSDEKTAESLFGGKQELRKRSAVFVNRPQTPTTPDQTTPLPVELPGSILLPSQGFSQADPPVTPARDKFQAPSSEVSTRSSVPSLDTSSTTDTEMDMFKNLTSPQKRSHRSKTFSSSPTKSTSKPFTAMSAEELMRCLPHLNMSVITGNWAPAMEVELKRIKGLLQGAAEVRLDSQADLKSYAMVSFDRY